jgi:hypothetical protein
LHVTFTTRAEPKVGVERRRGVDVRSREPQVARDRIDVLGGDPAALALDGTEVIEDFRPRAPEAPFELRDRLSWDCSPSRSRYRRNLFHRLEPPARPRQ